MKKRKNRILSVSRLRARGADTLPRRLAALFRRRRGASLRRVSEYAAISRGREA